MIKLDKNQMSKAAPFFRNQDDTLILSCLQGHMGDAWVDNLDSPTCALITVADFAFLGGDSNSSNPPKIFDVIDQFYQRNFIIISPPNEEWARIIEKAYDGKYTKFNRYSIKKEPDIFDTALLQSYVDKLPEGFEILPIREELYNESLSASWSRDLCSNFDSYHDYDRRGLGFAVVKDNELVCGASSYTVYTQGIEIEIDTKEEYRSLGLATACGAKLMLECLRRGLYPSWDAANKISVSLAEKLGYHYNKEYFVYGVDLL